jgi:hypothetical protein
MKKKKEKNMVKKKKKKEKKVCVCSYVRLCAGVADCVQMWSAPWRCGR